MPGLSSDVLNLGPDQEMKGKEADPSYLEYRVQPGIIDLDHLELVALERIATSTWMPHFRLTDPFQSPRPLSTTTSSRTQEHAKPPERGPKANRGETKKGSKAHKRDSAPGLAHPAEIFTAVHARSPRPGPGEVTAEVPRSPKMPLGFWGRLIIRIRIVVTKCREASESVRYSDASDRVYVLGGARDRC